MQWSRAEVAAAGGCMVILNGLIFDLGPYLDYHPGGREVLLEYASQDVTQAFRM